MTNWSDILPVLWFDNAPLWLLVAFLFLFVTGYPIAFSLGALSLLFGWAGLETGLIETTVLSSIPDGIFSHILFDPALLCLPLLLFFTELLVESGQMERASFAIKGMMDPLKPEREATKKRKVGIQIKSRAGNREVCGERSIFMSIFLPGAVVSIFVARLFDLPPEYLSVALFVPTTVLFSFYMINWLLELWVLANRRQAQRYADWSGQGPPPPLSRNWGRFLRYLFPPVLLVVLALTMVLHYKVSLFATLAALSLALCCLALLQGQLRPMRFLGVANRAAVATANLGAMLLAAFCFHSVFLALGGVAVMDQFSNLVMPSNHLPWLPLILLLIGLAFLGLFFDWIILTLVVLPMLMPVFSNMNFNSLLVPIWAGVTSQLASIEAAKILEIQGLIMQSKLWLAALVWLALITALVTYSRQSGEIVAKTLVYGKGASLDNRISMGLFVLLQLIGLTAAIIVPQVVLWLPSLLIG
ncbi:hypothetical protein [Cohaesibacter celericrescens]|uniref:hypothetical protein n=1 Tax=Cohaesibacter celericrescens TaxID=2067669 RepID=UPI003566D9D1